MTICVKSNGLSRKKVVVCFKCIILYIQSRNKIVLTNYGDVKKIEFYFK